MMPRISSSRMIRYVSLSILISVPPYFEMRTLSPFFTVKSTFLPLSSILPVPRATTLPSCGFSFAVSGIMIPPFFTSCSSIGCTSTRSPSGFTLTAAIGFIFLLLVFLVVPATIYLKRLPTNCFRLFLLVFVDDFELRVDDVPFAAFACAFFGAGTRARFGSGLRTGLRACRRRLLVKFSADFLELVLEIVIRPLHRVGVVAIDRVAHRGDSVFDLLLLVAGNLVAEFLQLLLALIREHVGVVLDLDGFLRLLVLVGMRFGFALHLLDFLFRKSRAAGDGNLLFLASAKVFRRDVQDTVRVDVEGHFDLRDAAWCRRNSIEMECAEILVVARQRPFALQHFDFHARLIVAVS